MLVVEIVGYRLLLFEGAGSFLSTDYCIISGRQQVVIPTGDMGLALEGLSCIQILLSGNPRACDCYEARTNRGYPKDRLARRGERFTQLYPRKNRRGMRGSENRTAGSKTGILAIERQGDSQTTTK